MSELGEFHLLLIGFVSFPIAKWLAIAIWDKMILDCERDIDVALEKESNK